jgi:SWI/SNF-related matrix-associated actin-dependent regulator of chromatin subfamily A3
VKARLRPSNYGMVSRPALFFSTSSSVGLEVSLIGDYFELLNLGQAFARLNKSFCSEARRLADFGVQFRAYLQKDSWEGFCATLNNFLPEPSEPTFAVDVNVYSFRHHADRIGDIFSQAGFFLQRSIHDFVEGLYYNPQMLELEGLEERQETSSNFASESMSELVEPESSVSLDRTELERQRNGSDLVDSILNSLSHQGILREIDTDQNQIRTKLLPYVEKIVADGKLCADGLLDIN